MTVTEELCRYWVAHGLSYGRLSVTGCADFWAEEISVGLALIGAPRITDLYLQAVAAGVNLGDLEQAERVRLLGRGR